MKKLLFILMISFPLCMNAQHFEVGGMIGISSYQGDLSPFTIKSTFKQAHPAFAVFARYNFSDFITAKFNVAFAKVSGNDNLSPYPENLERNLSFRSNVTEFGLTAEYNILGYQPYGLSRVFSPYIFGGIAYFRFKPKTQLDGTWVDLQPLGTEGQGIDSYGSPYKLGNWAIPFGIGVKYAISDLLNIGLELGMRYTFTDYLDDVSGTYVSYDELVAGNGETSATLGNRSGLDVNTGDFRGNDNGRNDWYFIGGITVSYNFMDNGLVGSRGRSKRKGCYN